MLSVVWDIIEPGLQQVGLYIPPDPTYGRYLTKPWAPEQALDDDPTIRTRRRRVFLHGRADPDSVDIEFAEDITLDPEELSNERIRGGRWVYYKSWEMNEESLASKEGLEVDMLLVHGMFLLGLSCIRKR
jgi:acylglycerol lipase